jgi:hypothetical protein
MGDKSFLTGIISISLCLHSSVVEHQFCKLRAGGSNPSAGFWPCSLVVKHIIDVDGSAVRFCAGPCFYIVFSCLRHGVF